MYANNQNGNIIIGPGTITEGETDILVGINAFNTEYEVSTTCGDPNYYSMYVSIYGSKEWISSVIHNNP